MKIATQCALAGSLLLAGIAHACATPVEVEGCQANAPGALSCDVLLSPASDFGGPDASVPIGGSGNPGSGGAPPGGNAGNGSNPPPGGSAGSGNPPAGGSGGGNGNAGSSSGGSGSGGSSSGGAAGSASGSGGAAGSGTAGTGSGGTGAGGTTAQSNFNPASCDFDDVSGCETLGCICAEERCQARCTNIVTCLRDNITCITEDDPLCAIRNNGAPNTCTAVVDTGGGINADTTQPSGIVRALVNCVCSDPRP
jgi:hypothetical protein